LAKTRIKISSSTVSETILTQENIAWGFEFDRKTEADRLYHTHSPRGEIVLVKDNFDLINGVTDNCEEFAITVEKYCAGDWAEEWVGVFTKFDCKIDESRCRLTIKAKTDDKYRCVSKVWENDVNIYAGTGTQIQVREFYGTFEAGIQECHECRVFSTPTPVCSSSTACVERTDVFPGGLLNDCPSGQYYAVTYFHRITGTGTTLLPPPYGSGWTLLSGTTWWRCPDDESFKIGVLKYGRRFDAVLEKLVAQVDCGLTVRSHFFGINATHAAPPDNDAYDYAALYYQDMTIHQKSDVKRPDGDQSYAFIWKMKLKEKLEDLQFLFNAFWWIDGDDLIIEHVSYRVSTAGIDRSAQVIPKEIEYEVTTPKEETYVFVDEDCSDFFKGVPITNNCGNDKKERRCSLFSTDLVFICDEANQDRINDDKWVLISNTVDSGSYFVNDQNKPLAWTNLHDKLHRHYRPGTAGTINGADVTFLSTRPVKKAPSFVAPYCCGDDVDPAKYVTTQLGNGFVQEQTENILKDTITLQLNYE